MPEKHCIAIDAMGGDHAPKAVVEGAILGALEHQVSLLLVGQQTAIEAELACCKQGGLPVDKVHYRIAHTDEVIEMDEAPATALRKKKNASIALAAQQVKLGEAQALVAAGSTGAAMAAALFRMGRIKGVERPAIAIPMPALPPNTPCLLLDAGANSDCTPFHLQQFGLMGKHYMEGLYGLEEARVGLLNIGTEPGKGNDFVKQVYDLLEADEALKFVGNVEGKHLFLGGADVAVTDGFTGNVALKAAEGVAVLLSKLIKQEALRTLPNKLVAQLAKPLIKKAYSAVDHEEFGGALLLGLNGICVIAHGSSSSRAINNAIRVAKQGVEAQVVERMQTAFAQKTKEAALIEASPA
jgi:glycerol-3-phosphate acyltransferase PlsX